MIKLLRLSGFLVSSLHNPSLLEQVKTMLENMLLLLILLNLISLPFQMKINTILQKLLRMVSMSLDFSWKALDGMKRKKLLKNHIQNNCSPIWSTFGFYQEREMILIMGTHTNVQFTRLQQERVLYQQLVTQRTSCFISTYQSRRNIKLNIG